ncbi:26S proteasome non-ATPase regulatory subunit 4 [Artemisia annua]|uniref:26S proteasome non-ATPase regulatory subunit 4 n=1 Tax=Artemisia annua TaxID=35608 RepID=A0A2U1P0Z0_ARTAN|nr:26S proteasome non-ATPase regulatory subunit 4 [Artemisia annua]
MEGEAIMICIDTSDWMDSTKSDSFKEQLAAIELYCTKKIESHPETVVGISGMGERSFTHLVRPTRELWRITGALYDATIGGYLLLVEAIADAYDVWFGCWDKELGVHLPKRIAVFAGGPVYDEKDDVQMFGEVLKERNVACDAISFGDPKRNKQELFDILVAAADNNGNCNVLHVPPESSVRDALLRSQIIQSCLIPFARLSKQNIINPLSRPQLTRSSSAPLASTLSRF